MIRFYIYHKYTTKKRNFQIFARPLGLEPRTTVLETVMLPLHYGRVLWFLKDSNPHHFIRSEECYPLHQRTIVTPDRFELPFSESKSLVLPLYDGVLKLER